MFLNSNSLIENYNICVCYSWMAWCWSLNLHVPHPVSLTVSYTPQCHDSKFPRTSASVRFLLKWETGNKHFKYVLKSCTMWLLQMCSLYWWRLEKMVGVFLGGRYRSLINIINQKLKAVQRHFLIATKKKYSHSSLIVANGLYKMICCFQNGNQLVFSPALFSRSLHRTTW